MNSDGEAKFGSGDWRYLRRELSRRTRQPFSDVPFVFYVFLAIIGLGCLGIWVEIIKVALASEAPSYRGVLTALATFFPALIGSSVHQLILTSTEKRDKVLVSFGYLISIVAVAAAILISVLHSKFPNITFWAAVVFAVGAVWLWWFTNADDPTYKSEAVGGDTNRRLKGNTSGFRR